MTATTISDTERREVAERLRSVAREVDRGGFSETIKHVKLAVFEDLDRYRPNGTLDRLADLIEPDHVGDSNKMVDRDALLALAEELEEEAGSVCGVCMGKSARRIREALGVES